MKQGRRCVRGSCIVEKHSARRCLHDAALVWIWRNTLILPQIRGCLLDEIAGFVEADPIAFCIAHRLPDTKVIRLPGMTISRGASELFDSLLLKFRYCSYLVFLLDDDGSTQHVQVAM
jgi:hypothetical protein